MSIAARKAALKLDQVGRPSDAPPRPSRPYPPTPLNRPSTDFRRKSANIPPVQTNGMSTSRSIGNEPNGASHNGVLPPPTITTSTADSTRPSRPPRLPPRKSFAEGAPTLPPRKQSQSVGRRDSMESISSEISNISSISALSIGTAATSASRSPSMDGSSSRVKAPPYDPASLPSLPPKRTKEETDNVRIPLKPTQSSTLLSTGRKPSIPAPAPPPRLPLRRTETADNARRLPPEIPVSTIKRSALSFGMNNATETPPSLPSNWPKPPPAPSESEGPPGVPPPIPFASRPSQSQVQNVRSDTTSTGCLKCRDFSAPDAHAARFPRESIPNLGTEWLAHQLTSPFPSVTDKARVIFTWLHHNISYDVAAFFSGNLKPSTPSSTLTSGLAVCEGYAGLFTAIATHAGLESFVVSGHGKGYGFAALSPSSPLPSFSSNHAWNAVKLDSGAWKLIDACWGAGTVGGPGQPYAPRFNPALFTMSNDDFGLRHFPSDRAHFFRADGRVPSWGEYIVGDRRGEPPLIYTDAEAAHGVAPTSFRPALKAINVSQPVAPTVRFSFAKVCPHWDNVSMGAGVPFLFVVGVHNGAGGPGKKEYVPFSTDAACSEWWCDVPVERLGSKGQEVMVHPVDTVGGKKVRGLEKEAFLRARGKQAMSFGNSVAKWDLV
ncbi:MAG: hypothetical protein M1833_003792 [Piccolia ochrophora]|nr:MAG: hypothetical protein M1833_003792 [Piccolia ochrophora]